MNNYPSNEKEYQELKEKALEQFKRGKSLFSKGGAFSPLLKQFIELALQEEIRSQVAQERLRGDLNKRNGYKPKTLKGLGGEFTIQNPKKRGCVSYFLSEVRSNSVLKTFVHRI